MRVLADMHHGGLYESLRILFEDRLGWELFRPMGMEWYRDGYWMVHDHPQTAQQYLGLQLTTEYDAFQQGWPGHWLNKGWQTSGDGVYLVASQDFGQVHRGISLERFKAERFDIVLSSMLVHFDRFERLRRECQPQAKHIFQMGNMWAVPAGCRNLLNSTSVAPPADINHVRYHQEFSRDLFYPASSPEPRSVCNLMHYQQPRYQAEFDQLERIMARRGWRFHNYGCGNRDGVIHPVTRIGDVIRHHGFVWHNKAGGEGYGFNIFNSGACGRPVICHRKLYRGMISESLLANDSSCIDMDGLSIEAVAEKLETVAQDHDRLVSSASQHFDDIVDFDAEFIEIKKFLERLL